MTRKQDATQVQVNRSLAQNDSFTRNFDKPRLAQEYSAL